MLAAEGPQLSPDKRRNAFIGQHGGKVAEAIGEWGEITSLFVVASYGHRDFLLPEEVEKLIISKPLTNPVRGHYQEFDQNGCLILQPIEKARLMFITQIFSNGMRVSDLLFLRWNNLNFRDKNPQVIYKMYKTGEDMGFNLTNNLIWLLQHFVDTNDRFEDETRQEDLKCISCGSACLNLSIPGSLRIINGRSREW